MKPSILILNAALNGKKGNTAVLLDRAVATFGRRAQVVILELGETTGFPDVEPFLRRADAFMIGTGTYWDSWSHFLQKFLEDASLTEGTELWLGKPVAVIVTMHSVGGKGILSRLQGVLTTFGCLTPPMSGQVYSLVNQICIETRGANIDDLWCPKDMDVICHNLLASLKPKPRYKAWPVERDTLSTRWIHTAP